ncbi:Protein argonaute 18, partial [Tolypocladium paradoxum]
KSPTPPWLIVVEAVDVEEDAVVATAAAIAAVTEEIAAAAAMEAIAEAVAAATAEETVVAAAAATEEIAVGEAVGEAAEEAAEADAAATTRRQQWPLGTHPCAACSLAPTDTPSSINGTCPAPDAAITTLEDKVIRAQAASLAGLTSQMAKATLQSQSGGTAEARPTDLFPLRPAFGTGGKPVSLWANYFRVNVEPAVLYKYNLEFAQVATESAADGNGDRTTAKAQSRDVKGRKLYFACQELVRTLTAADKTLVLATEYKSQLVALKKLALAENPLRIRLPVEAASEKWDVVEVTVHGPTEAPVDALLSYLGTMNDGPNDAVFPKYPEAVDALNVVFGHGPRSRLHQVAAVGSARFFPFGADRATANLFQDHHALVAARGFFQSARLGTGRLLLNANVTHGVFRVSGRLDQLFDSFRLAPTQVGSGFEMRKMRAFAKFMPKTRVWVDLLLADGRSVRKTKAIHGIVAASELQRRKPADGKPLQFQPGFEYPGPKQVKFFMDDGSGSGRYITVFEYFQQKYKRTLKDYPLVNLGRADKPTLFPAELIEIQPGQSVKAKLTMNETTAMLDVACRSPYANALSISTDARKTLGLDDAGLGRFGVAVDKSLLTVNGRVLSVPVISYLGHQQKRSDVQPRDGSWNMKNVRVVRPGAAIERWAYLNILKAGRGGQLDSPVEVGTMVQFAKFLAGSGIGIKETPLLPPHGKAFMRWEEAMEPGGALESFFRWARDQRVQHIVFILTEKDSQGLYPKIKTLGDCTWGIHTSVTTAANMKKEYNPMYWANVGLKINLKAGGVNHRLRDDLGLLREGRTMVAGYDVTHPTNMPAREGAEAPSLVGLVASVDKDLGQWPAASWEQPAKQEMLSGRLVDAFKSRLELWQKHNAGRLPDNVVIFRDGVSEGQFAQVLEQELPSIREACRDRYPPAAPQPRLTIVVSVKRHQTRFFPTSADDMSASGNVRNGTVVDRGVTQARYWDFFLTAHHALKGTARPAHYTVLLDEIFRAKFKAAAANELERLTHELCYLYGRATKAVSICPPAYYADIVCERARAHRPEIFDVGDAESVSTAAGQGAAAAVPNRQVHEALKNSMYYI